MKIRRWSAGVLAASLLVPGLTACKSDGTESAAPTASNSAATSAIPSDAKEALLASTKEISKGNFSFTINGGELNGTGKVHAPTKSAEMSMTGGDAASADLTMEMHLVFIDTDTWVMVQFGGSMATAMPKQATSGKYQHLDRSRIKGIDQLEFDFNDVDPAGSAALTKAITEVRKTGDGLYAGTIDATKATDSDILDADALKALAGQASALPFTAKLDAQGRLVELGLEVPAAGSAPAQNLVVTYADYGTTTAVQKPPADQVVEASEDVYKMFK
ncbi:hypothetical protein [Micromonospora sagamiensis]|uniref:Lipoprotein n=1 Tax=Micromonospora sagamiensis TaxID=47875 RepID=A0A562WLV3_9ACTN|nr:hypothetical protein [Micromonospora sagamiensis]TWJ31279.1 hypothetical protein JD81_04834 [Micromonospora sagamiensis]BCL15676.1 hypothetical protein GCM10017556_34150 [Micromonospora sagamiensis]